MDHLDDEETLLHASQRSSLESSDDRINGHASKKSKSVGKKGPCHPITLHGLITSLLAAAVVGLLVIQTDGRLHTCSPTPRVFRPNTNDTEATRDWLGCGKSADEARKRGCHFDVMMSSWIHADCFYSDLMEEYLKRGNYTWYRDKDFTKVMPENEVRMGNHFQIWVRKDFHYDHCAYIWETQLRAYRLGRAVPQDAYAYAHTKHCVGLLVNQDLPSNSTTVLTALPDRCGRPDWMKNVV